MTDARALAVEALRKARGKLAAFFPSQSETLHEIDQSLAALSTWAADDEAAARADERDRCATKAATVIEKLSIAVVAAIRSQS